MSDSSQRRGPYSSAPRGLPRDTEDPLAELARLVSQGDAPRARSAAAEPRSGYAPPRAPYTPPAVDRVQDRLEPLGYRGESRATAYGSAQPTYNTETDFFADEPLRGSQDGSSYRTYRDDRDDFESDYADSYQSRTYRDDFDETESTIYPGIDDAGDHDMPVRRRGGKLKAVAALTGLAVVAGLGAWGYISLGGNDTTANAPPVIKKDERPIKVVADAKTTEKPLKDPARVLPNSEARVGPGPEEPAEKPSPRVILPGAPDAAAAETRIAEAPPSSPPPQMPAAPSIPEPDTAANGPRQQGNGPRVVRTLTIRPDGSAAPAPVETIPAIRAQTAPPPQEAIQGQGPAEGMSLQQRPELGIMQNPPPEPTAPRQQTAFAPENVPIPQPRPQINQAPPPIQAESPPPQARAATQVPAPAAASGFPPAPAGPPSSPQSEVKVTNKRPLQPQGDIPPPRSSQRQTTTPATPVRPAAVQPPPQQTPQQAPRQVAMVGSPAPLGAPPPAAPAPLPPAAPQVATVAGASGAFGVQLTAQRSEQEAIAVFNSIKQRHPQVLGAYNPSIARADLGPDRGVFYRAMVPAQSQQDAANLCIQFKSQGVDCIVQRR